jgi:uncharacterized membrane protein HdeD (DUF308 family)
MRRLWSSNAPGPLGFAPAFLGIVLILIGVLLFVWPALLSFVVASIFVAAGVSVLGFAWQVTYRRVDGTWQSPGSDDAPPPP